LAIGKGIPVACLHTGWLAHKHERGQFGRSKRTGIFYASNYILE